MSFEVIASPMQGIVCSMCVAVGDDVTEGDVLCMIEVMKMQMPIESNVNGKVTEIYVEEKKQVSQDERLMAIEY